MIIKLERTVLFCLISSFTIFFMGISPMPKNENLLLIKAVKNDDIINVKKLLKDGVNVNFKDSENLTAIQWSVINDNVEILKLLVKFKADVHVKEPDGSSLLHAALQAPIRGIIPNKPDYNRRSLNVEERYCLVLYLLKLALKADDKNNDGIQPIHLAARLAGDPNQIIRLIELLIQHGSPVNEKSNRGYTPMDYAQYDEIRGFFEQKVNGRKSDL